MSSKLKYKVGGNKIEVIPEELPGSIVTQEVYDGMTVAEKAVIDMIASNSESFMTTVQINGKDVTVYATPGCSITVPQKQEAQELPAFHESVLQRSGSVFPENHPVLYLAYSDVSIEEIVKRNIFGWVKLDVVNTRCSTVINLPVRIGPETFGTVPLNTIKLHTLNESHIVDSNIQKVESISATDIVESSIVGAGTVKHGILDKAILHAKTIELNRVFLYDLKIDAKTITLDGDKSKGNLAVMNHDFTGTNAEIFIEAPTDIYKVDTGTGVITFARGGKDKEAHDYYASSNLSTRDGKVTLINTDNVDKYLAQLSAELIGHHNFLHPDIPVNEDALESVVLHVGTAIMSRERLNKMLKG